jgi:energy-coupling factor transporter transmembrane protein EcfT
MTGFDRLSYQSRWFHVAPERKFLFWLLLMVLAFTLPPLGQGMTLALIAALTCWLLRVSFWRWCRWMALPFGFLLVGVLTILFSVSRDPQMLLSLPLGSSGWASRRRADDRQSDLLAQPGGAGGHLLAGAESAVPAAYCATQARAGAAAADRANPADLALYFYSVRRSAGDSPCANIAFWLP